MSGAARVASNLMGCIATGHWRDANPDYVFPMDRKWRTKYRADQLEPSIWYRVTGEVVAVTSESSGTYADLVVWVLVDGVPKRLCPTTAKVMPRGWTPGYREDVEVTIVERAYGGDK